ncbi:MAG: PQQ-binding-like beta-propeller repeat protein [Acidimicrobiales bacterium]
MQRNTTWLIPALVVALVLAGCGSGDDAESGDPGDVIEGTEASTSTQPDVDEDVENVEDVGSPPAPVGTDCVEPDKPFALVANLGGEVGGFDLDGNELWRSQFDDTEVSGTFLPTRGANVVGGIALVGSSESTTIVSLESGASISDQAADRLSVAPDCSVLLSGGGTVIALDATGEELWSRNGGLAQAIVSDPPAVLIGSDSSGFAEVVDLASGLPLWAVDDGFDEVGVAGSLVWSQDSENFTTYYDGLTGNVVNVGADVEGRRLGDPTLESVYQRDGNSFVVIDLATGAEVYSGLTDNESEVAAAGSSGIVYNDPNNNLIYVPDVREGSVAWQVPLESDPGSLSASSMDDGVLAVELPGRLMTVSSDGDVLFEIETFDVDRVEAAGSRILVTTGSLTIVHTADGAVVAEVASHPEETGAVLFPAEDDEQWGAEKEVVPIEGRPAGGEEPVHLVEHPSGAVLWES